MSNITNFFLKPVYQTVLPYVGALICVGISVFILLQNLNLNKDFRTVEFDKLAQNYFSNIKQSIEGYPYNLNQEKTTTENLSLGSLLQNSIVKHEDIDFMVIDHVSSSGSKVIYSGIKSVSRASNARDVFDFLKYDYSYENVIWLDGHKMYLYFVPSSKFISKYNNNDTWALFVVFMLISALVAGHMYTSQSFMKKLIQARSNAEEANALQRDFLATMSHEIRTPMNAIIGMGDLLLDEGVEGRERKRVKTIVNAAEGLLQILNDILDFSKIDSGKLDMEEMSFSPREIVEDVTDLYAVQSQNKGVELTVWQSSDIPSLIIGDQGRVRQILNNLLSNAIKFTSRGHILIQIEMLKETSDGEAIIKFGVKDTGIGFNEEVKESLFERFRQADSSTTRQYGGTGLGLAICKKLVHVMNGEIGVDSEVGKGSYFWFTIKLPIDKDVSNIVDMNDDLSGVSVSIVDDVAVNLEIFESYIKRWNGNSKIFGSPKVALDNITKVNSSVDPYDIIIVDHLMPELSGVELLQFIRRNKKVYQSPAIVISSYMDDKIRKSIDEMDDVYHLSKPVHPERLKGMILKMLGKSVGSVDSSSYDFENNIDDFKVKNTRILVAEDNHANQEIVERVLERLGCSVTCVWNGKEAIETLTDFPFDLVFMDGQMPEMDGFEASSILKDMMSSGEIKEIPIVALTANAMKGDRERCLEAGMSDYLTKPVKKEDFISILSKWLPDKVQKSGASGEESLIKQDNENLKERDKMLKRYGEPIFDENIYAELKDMIGDDVAHSILIKYKDSTSEDKNTFLVSFENMEYNKLSEYAHKLKSSSAQIGAVRLSKISADLEDYFREDSHPNGVRSPDKMLSYVEKYQEVINETIEELDKRIAG